MHIEENEIAPQMKRMKLSGESEMDYEISRSSFIEKDLQKEMKFVFPYLSDEVSDINIKLMLINYFRKSERF